MANLTRKQAREYVRVKVDKLKNDSVIDSFLNIEINFSQRKVQKDLMSLELDEFNKQAFVLGAYAPVPSDKLDTPDAIIDVKSSTGARASVSTAFTGSDNDITFTWNEPGTGGNITDVIQCVDGLSSGGPTIVTSFSAAGVPSFVIYFVPGETSADIITEVNADNVMSIFVTAANAAGNNGTGTITLGVGMSFTTAGGTGTGFYPADKTSISNYNRISDNSLIAPSSVQVKYAIVGDINGTQLFQFLPKSVTVSLVHYKYLVADLTADTDTLTIPAGNEELVLLDVISKSWDILKKEAAIATVKAEYENEKNKADANYQKQLQAKLQEKTRIEAADKGN